MAKTAPVKSPSMEKCMIQDDSPKEVTTVKEMNDRSLLLSSDKMTCYFIFDASNRSSLTVAVPKNYSFLKEN